MLRQLEVHAGGPSSPRRPQSPVPHLPCQANWNLLDWVPPRSGPGPPQMAPRGSPRQEDVTEAQEGKTTRSRPLWGTLCATGFGSAPVLTSSGAGTQMYSSLVVLFRASKQNSEFLTKLERDFFFPPLHKMTGNKLMAESIRRDVGESRGSGESVDLSNMSDRRGCTWGRLQRFTTSLRWVFPLPQTPASLNPRSDFVQDEFHLR